jgi:hypothetical protein
MPRRGKSDPNPYQKFYAAIGRFVLTWTDLEISLDLLLLTLIPEDDQRNAKLPHQLRDKIGLIRAAIKSLSNADQMAVTEALDEISGYADTRHDFVHGGRISHFIEQGTITVTLGRLLQLTSATT